MYTDITWLLEISKQTHWPCCHIQWEIYHPLQDLGKFMGTCIFMANLLLIVCVFYPQHLLSISMAVQYPQPCPVPDVSLFTFFIPPQPLYPFKSNTKAFNYQTLLQSLYWRLEVMKRLWLRAACVHAKLLQLCLTLRPCGL